MGKAFLAPCAPWVVACLLIGMPGLMAQDAAPISTATPVAASPIPSPASPAPEDTLPPIIVQIEPPPISISSSMIGVPGPLGAKPAEGKPIVAEFVTENYQRFADGNRIARSTTSVIYRDAQGRLRRESHLLLPGLSIGVITATFVTIIDRRLGCGWVLDPQEMVAHRYQLGGPSYVARLNAQGGGSRLLTPESKAASSSGGDAMAADSRHWHAHAFSQQMRLSQDSPTAPPAMSSASGQPSPASAASGSLPEETGFASAPAMRLDQPFLAAPNPVRTENLGEEMILGYRAHGTRVITTLPAGEIGNDRPIDIVSEQWFSPDLELVMRSLHRDPWGGEFTTTVTRVRKGEQPAELFSVPSQYKMIDADTEEERHVFDGQRGAHQPGGAPW